MSSIQPKKKYNSKYANLSEKEKQEIKKGKTRIWREKHPNIGKIYYARLKQDPEKMKLLRKRVDKWKIDNPEYFHEYYIHTKLYG